MPINKFDGDLFTQKVNMFLVDRAAVIVPAWCAPTWQQLYTMSTEDDLIELIRASQAIIKRQKRRAAIRAVIVPAVMRSVFIFVICAACF